MKSSLLTALCIFILSHTAWSQTIIYVNIAATGANNGTSWQNAYKDLQVAIDAAKKNNILWVAKGTYKPGKGSGSITQSFVAKSDIAIFGGFKGTETQFAQRDFKTNLAILSGDHADNDDPVDNTLRRSDNAQHVLYADTSVLNFILDGLVISGGNTAGAGGANDERRGGGFLCYGEVKIKNCIFRNNYGYFGGAFYPRAQKLNYTLENCTFTNNTADAGGGGALYVVSPDGIGTITNCTFELNKSSGSGGALNVQISKPNFRNCKFLFNTASGTGARGGAVFSSIPGSNYSNCEFAGNMATTSGGAININGEGYPSIVDSCMFTDNESGFGGAVAMFNGSKNTAQALKVTFNFCQFENNTASLSGGATLSGFKANTIFNDCSFKVNMAGLSSGGFGGAIFSQNDSTSVSIFRSQFELNSALKNGGALSAINGAKINIEKCNFEGNDAVNGGAISFIEDTIDLVGSLRILNSKIEFNQAKDYGGGLYLYNTKTDVNNCIIGNNSCEEGKGFGGGLSIVQAKSPSVAVKFINTTIATNKAKSGFGISTFTNAANLLKIELLNTILYQPDGPNYQVESGPQVILSLGGNLSSDKSLTISGTNDIINTDPLFVNPGLEDYHLKSGSPCINKGIKTAEVLSLDIENRIRDNSPDKGCHEFGAPVPNRDLEINNSLVIMASNQCNTLQFTIESDWKGMAQYTVFDVTGKIIITGHFNKWSTKENIIHEGIVFMPGVYFLNVVHDTTIVGKSFFRD